MATVLLIQGDGSNGSTDIKNTATTDYYTGFTKSGNTSISTAQSKFGGSSIYLDGSGDFIDSTIPYVFGDFTVEAWFYCTYADGTDYIIIQSSDQYYGYGMQVLPGFTFYFNGNPVCGTGKPASYTWTHIAITRAGTTLRLFMNGNLYGSLATSGTANLQVRFGGGTGGDYPFKGYIDQIRIDNSVAHYTANFTPSSFPISTKRYFSTIRDTVPNLLAFYSSQDELLTTVYPLTTSGDVSASSPLLVVSDDDSMLFDNASATGVFANLNGFKDLIICFFIKTLTASQTIISKSGVFSIAINSDGKITFQINSESVTGQVTITDDLPHLVSCIFRPGNGLIVIDGQADTEVALSTMTITDDGTQNLVVGAFTGVLDEIFLANSSFRPSFFYWTLLSANGVDISSNYLSDDADSCDPGAPPGDLFSQISLCDESRDVLDCYYGSDITYSAGVPTLFVKATPVLIDGYVTVEATPASRQVWLFEWHNKRIVRTTWSDPITGYYKFDDVKAGNYFVWSEDYKDVFKPQSTMEIAT
jgi:hypothetical protein